MAELQDRFEKTSSELNESKAKNEDLGDQNNDIHKIVWRLKVEIATNHKLLKEEELRSKG